MNYEIPVLGEQVSIVLVLHSKVEIGVKTA